MVQPTGMKVSFKEFLATAGVKKAEWVDGEIIEEAPVSDEHSSLQLLLAMLLSAFVEEQGLGRVFGETYPMRLEDTAREPDIHVYLGEWDQPGRSTYHEGPCDLAVEIISPESRRRDRGDKFFEYEAARMKEYWLIDPDRRQAEFYVLDEHGIYRLIQEDTEGKLHSRVLPGLWVKVDWLWNRPKVLTALREIGLT